MQFLKEGDGVLLFHDAYQPKVISDKLEVLMGVGSLVTNLHMLMQYSLIAVS